MKKFLLILIIISLISVGILFFLDYSEFKSINLYLQTKVVINNKSIYLEIADQPLKQLKGLSNRKTLAANSGMLFVYPDKKIRSFWMKDMNFPLDIIWINDDKIVGINKNLAPEGNQPIRSYKSPVPVNYVIEVNSGFTDKYGIKIDDYVIYYE